MQIGGLTHNAIRARPPIERGDAKSTWRQSVPAELDLLDQRAHRGMCDVPWWGAEGREVACGGPHGPAHAVGMGGGAEWQGPTARPTELDMHGPRFVAGGDDFAEAETRDSVTRLRKHLAYAEELDRVLTTRAQDGHGASSGYSWEGRAWCPDRRPPWC